MFGPIFETASESHSDITFGKIDTEDHQGLAGAARITSIPTLMAFRDGVLVFSQAGALPAASLEKLPDPGRHGPGRGRRPGPGRLNRRADAPDQA